MAKSRIVSSRHSVRWDAELKMTHEKIEEKEKPGVSSLSHPGTLWYRNGRDTPAWAT